MLLPKTNPIRDKGYIKWVATNNACMKCKFPMATQSAHLGQSSMAMKSGDNTIAPLCTVHLDHTGKQVLGCHEKLDRHLEVHYWNENLSRALNTAISAYGFYKRGEHDKAKMIFGAFNGF